MIINGYRIERGADLFGADLFGANLSGANLSGANLLGVNLSGANLYNTKGILRFTLGRHLGFSYQHDGIIYVKIGCECHTLEHWNANIKAIGSDNNYSAEEIKRYSIQLSMLPALWSTIWK